MHNLHLGLVWAVAQYIQAEHVVVWSCGAQEIRGFYHQQTGVVPQQLDARLASAEPAATAAASQTAAAGEAAGLRNSCSSSHGSHAQKLEAETELEHAVLRPVQVQDRTAAGADASVNAAAGLRQSRQRQQQQQEKPKQQPSTQQQQPAEALTPRAARLQRRLQQQHSSELSQQQDAENTCPANVSTAKQTAAGAVGATAAGCGTVKLQCISADEFGQLPSWCKSLLSVDVLNGVLQELSGVIAGR
jgi:hypothetical protein